MCRKFKHTAEATQMCYHCYSKIDYECCNQHDGEFSQTILLGNSRKDHVPGIHAQSCRLCPVGLDIQSQWKESSHCKHKCDVGSSPAVLCHRRSLQAQVIWFQVGVQTILQVAIRIVMHIYVKAQYHHPRQSSTLQASCSGILCADALA